MKSLLLIPIFVCQLLVGQTWQKLADFPGTARDDGSRFIIGNKVYCGIGLEVGWTCPNDFYTFDLNTETWSVSSSFPAGQQRQYACGFSVNGKGYIFGGINCSNTFLNDVWEYNPATTNWTQKTAMPAVGRSGSTSFVINDTAYILGGRTATANAIPDLWAYDPASDTWIQKANIPVSGTWRGVAFNYKHTGYAGLGRNAQDQSNKEFYSYNVPDNTWSLIPGYTHIGRAYTGYAQSDSIAFLFGGADSLGFIDVTLERIDLITFSVTAFASFPDIARKGCMSFTANNSFYITTGVSTNTRFKETWKIDQVVGLEEMKTVTGVVVAPNPNKGNFTIAGKAEIIKALTIYDQLGNRIFELKDNNSTTIQVHLDIASGVYYLECNMNKGKQFHQKLIVQ